MLIGSSALEHRHPLRELLAPTRPTRRPREPSQLGSPIRTTSCSRGHSSRTPSTMAAVVRGLVLHRRDQQPHPGLVDDERQLVAAIGRVDVDEDRADLRRGVLDQHPLGAVRRPDPDPVALLDPHREQATSDPVDVVVQLAVGPSAAARHVDERLTLREPLHRPARGWPRSCPPAAGCPRPRRCTTATAASAWSALPHPHAGPLRRQRLSPAARPARPPPLRARTPADVVQAGAGPVCDHVREPELPGAAHRVPERLDRRQRVRRPRVQVEVAVERCRAPAPPPRAHRPAGPRPHRSRPTRPPARPRPP